MQLKETFTARGHPNIRASHRTTLMVTKDTELTARGDCIVAVTSEKGLMDLDPRVKKAIQTRGSKVRLVFETGGLSFEVSGEGDPELPLSHRLDMVARKSSYVSDRTLMIKADKSACDIPKPLVELLRNREQVVKIILSVES
jgi:hypothetical protein